jgi:hypothetical protein
MGLISPKTREAIKGAIDKMDVAKLKMVFANVFMVSLVWFLVFLNFVKQLVQPIYRFGNEVFTITVCNSSLSFKIHINVIYHYTFHHYFWIWHLAGQVTLANFVTITKAHMEV